MRGTPLLDTVSTETTTKISQPPNTTYFRFHMGLVVTLGTQRLFTDRRRMEPATHGWPFMCYAPVRNRRLYARMFTVHPPLHVEYKYVVFT